MTPFGEGDPTQEGKELLQEKVSLPEGRKVPDDELLPRARDVWRSLKYGGPKAEIRLRDIKDLAEGKIPGWPHWTQKDYQRLLEMVEEMKREHEEEQKEEARLRGQRLPPEEEETLEGRWEKMRPPGD